MENLIGTGKSIITNGSILFFSIFCLALMIGVLKILYASIKVMIKKGKPDDIIGELKELLYFIVYGFTGYDVLNDESNKGLRFSAIMSTLLHLSIPIAIYILVNDN